MADDLVLTPWWVSLVLALLAYGFLPAVLPTAFVNAEFVGIIALVLVAIAAISALRSLKTGWMLDRQTGLASLRDLRWKRFEDVLGEAYRRQGYAVEGTLGGGADGGVDLILRRDGGVTVVQCKRWRGKRVPVQVVRELYGVMMDRRASAAKVVATAAFTPDAVAFARGKPIELVDAAALTRLVRGVQTPGCAAAGSLSNEPDHLSPDCPRCSSTMVLREARRALKAGQKFWGCSRYPVCRGTVEI